MTIREPTSPLTILVHVFLLVKLTYGRNTQKITDKMTYFLHDQQKIMLLIGLQMLKLGPFILI